MDQTQAKFEGWAKVELFGHQSEIGYVTTQYFGGAAMFQIDVPELPEREYELESPQYVEVDGYSKFTPKGAKVRRPGVPARSRLVSPGAVYAMNPCTEDTARKVIEREFGRHLILLDLKDAQPALPGETQKPVCDVCLGGDHEDCESDNCQCDDPIHDEGFESDGEPQFEDEETRG